MTPVNRERNRTTQPTKDKEDVKDLDCHSNSLPCEAAEPGKVFGLIFVIF